MIGKAISHYRVPPSSVRGGMGVVYRHTTNGSTATL